MVGLLVVASGVEPLVVATEVGLLVVFAVVTGVSTLVGLVVAEEVAAEVGLPVVVAAVEDSNIDGEGEKLSDPVADAEGAKDPNAIEDGLPVVAPSVGANVGAPGKPVGAVDGAGEATGLRVPTSGSS